MPPRPVLPRQFYLITRRCTQRQLLLRPDRETNNAFTYCLIVAALRYGIDVLLPCAMSNHHHDPARARAGGGGARGAAGARAGGRGRA